MKAKWFGIFLMLVMLASLFAPTTASATPAPVGDEEIGWKIDNRPSPLDDAKFAARMAQLQADLRIKANLPINGSVRKNVDMYNTASEDPIFVVAAEFGDLIGPYGGTAGPLHNQIPKPVRSKDNTSMWVKDFNQAHYNKLMFSANPGDVSVRTFYIEQSSSTYAVNGVVSDWVQVPYNEASYGESACGNCIWNFVNGGADAWYDSMIADGMTADEINAYLSGFDIWDRYDYDGDFNYNEPDGYIDHYQTIHAGVGAEAGGGAQGGDAIWSHSWFAWYGGDGPDGAGPAWNDSGGARIGNSDFWVGKYTVDPEDGGVGVFAHEFGHDIGLPDMYDYYGENNTGFWSIMSSGSWGSTGKPSQGIGSKPTGFGMYEKFILGWADYAAAFYNQSGTLPLGPAEHASEYPQAFFVILPEKEVITNIGAAYSGSYYYHSGAGANLDNSMTYNVTLPAAPVTLTAWVNYDIEEDWDYAYLTVNGTSVHTNLSTNYDPYSQNLGEGITGSSGGWVSLTADLSAYAGQNVNLGFRYWTDAYTNGTGFSVDNIYINGGYLSGAEVADPDWNYHGFYETDGMAAQYYSQYYLAENRQYWGYDKVLKTGPYNFGFLNTRPDWVEHFPYQDGMVVWYLDYSFESNDVNLNCFYGRCGGMALPVDSHPGLLLRPDNGSQWRPRIQVYDAPFGLQRTDKMCLHVNTVYKKCYGGLPGNPLFDDTVNYEQAWTGAYYNSPVLPGIGVQIQVLYQGVNGGPMVIELNP